MKRAAALVRQTQPRRRLAGLLNQAAMVPPSRRALLMKRVGPLKRMPTKYHNKKGRQFYLTLRGAYVLRQNGRSLYGRKATDPNAPLAIRPKIKRTVS